MSRRFDSWLAPQFERFVAIKRAGGADYCTQARLLAGFDRYLVEHARSAPLRRDTLIAFLVALDRMAPRSRDNVVDVVWQALGAARRYGVRIDPLPPRPRRAPLCCRLRHPRLVTDEEMRTLITAARRLGHAHHLRPTTYATLYGLLCTTGLRIGEALALDVGDLALDAGLLTVRRGKFNKSRVLPLKTSTVVAIQRYLNDHRRPNGRMATEPFFVSAKRRRLSYTSAAKTFKSLCITAEIAEPLPRLHCIRHSFAVLRVVAWYQANRDVNALLPALSTYLGHVSVENTRTYLQANGLLLEQASQRFSSKAARLDEVLP